MITPDTVTIRPSDMGMTDLIDPKDATVLAAMVVSCASHGRPELDLREVTGLTTAFTNSFFSALFASMAPEVVRTRVVIRTANSTQREVLRRSIQAATAALKSPPGP